MPPGYHHVNGTSIAINQEGDTKVTPVVDTCRFCWEKTPLCLDVGQAHVISLSCWASGSFMRCPFSITKDKCEQEAAFGGTSYWKGSKCFGKIL